MTTTIPGLLMVWTDILEPLEADFNEWYSHEHMPERILGVPGFARTRHFIATRGQARSPRTRVVPKVALLLRYPSHAWQAMTLV